MPAGDCTWHPGVPSGPIHPPSLKAQLMWSVPFSPHQGQEWHIDGCQRTDSGHQTSPGTHWPPLRPTPTFGCCLASQSWGPRVPVLISVFLERFSKRVAFCWRILRTSSCYPSAFVFSQKLSASISTWNTHTHTHTSSRVQYVITGLKEKETLPNEFGKGCMLHFPPSSVESVAQGLRVTQHCSQLSEKSCRKDSCLALCLKIFKYQIWNTSWNSWVSIYGGYPYRTLGWTTAEKRRTAKIITGC